MLALSLATPRLRARPPANRNEAACRLAALAWRGRIELPDLEGLALGAWDRARLPRDLPDPAWLARRLGIRLCPGVPAGSQYACLRRLPSGPMIVYRPALPRRARGTAILHETMHWLLDPLDHDEWDVWVATMALALPLTSLRELEHDWTVRGLARAALHVDHWMLRERAAMARMLYRERAA